MSRSHADGRKRECGYALDETRNECTDYTTPYYINVIRNAAQPWSCDPYELTITNGNWNDLTCPDGPDP